MKQYLKNSLVVLVISLFVVIFNSSAWAQVYIIKVEGKTLVRTYEDRGLVLSKYELINVTERVLTNDVYTYRTYSLYNSRNGYGVELYRIAVRSIQNQDWFTSTNGYTCNISYVNPRTGQRYGVTNWFDPQWEGGSVPGNQGKKTVIDGVQKEEVEQHANFLIVNDFSYSVKAVFTYTALCDDGKTRTVTIGSPTVAGESKINYTPTVDEASEKIHKKVVWMQFIGVTPIRIGDSSFGRYFDRKKF